MTGYERSVRDADLDAFLRALMHEDDDVMPGGILDDALMTVARTPQARRPISISSALTAWAPAWTIAAVVVVAMGLGLALANWTTGPSPAATPAPTPSPSPSPSARAGLVPIAAPTDAYELQVPADWPEVESGYPDARTWSGPDGSLMISYGASIFDGGEVTVCAPPAPTYNACMPLEHGFSTPYDPKVDGVGPISLEVWLDRCDGACPLTETETSLYGEAAAYSRVVIGGRQLTYVSTFHDQRPVILYWSEPQDLADETRVRAMLASFRFGAPRASATPFLDPTELVTYTNREGGYEILIPRMWGEGSNDLSPSVRQFGSGRGAGSRGQPALMISVGDRDGSVVVCQGQFVTCSTIKATTLDKLGAALTPVPVEFKQAVAADAKGELVLAGEPGRYKRPGYPGDGRLGIADNVGGGNCLGCPGMRYYAYAFHDGRPIVVSVDYWTIAFESPAYVRNIVESLQLLE